MQAAAVEGGGGVSGQEVEELCVDRLETGLLREQAEQGDGTGHPAVQLQRDAGREFGFLG